MQYYLKVASHSHCSVLIKMLPGYENVYAGHSRYVTACIYNNPYMVILV